MYDFYTQLTRILNTGKTRSILLVGDVEDLFFNGESFVPIVDFLSKRCHPSAPSGNTFGLTQIIFEINRSVRVLGDEEELRKIWNESYGIVSKKYPTNPALDESLPNNYDVLIKQTGENPTFALEFIRKLIDRTRDKRNCNLLVIIEGIDMLVPEASIATMNFADRKRVAIMCDWFSDPKFTNGHDSVVLIAESRSMVCSQVTRLPQLLTINIPNPTQEHRRKFAETTGKEPKFITQTAGLSIHAYRQIIIDPDVKIEDVVGKVEDYIVSLVGDDVVEFKRPTHTLDDCVGYKDLKVFLRTKFIPSIAGPSEKCISGALVAGPIGGGKTFIMEAVASMLSVPVMVLKNFRSQWFGQTDVLVERIKRAIYAIVKDSDGGNGSKILLFVDEADTAMGSVSKDAHETERRATGKIQALMSDSELRGKAIWLLMTARPHLLSPDIKRSGRAGELIIPILDPSDYGEEDHDNFISWAIGGIKTSEDQLVSMRKMTTNFSSADYQSLKTRILAEDCVGFDNVLSLMNDTLLPDIGKMRRYQKLQALINCTRRRLIPPSYPYDPEQWRKEIGQLESKGIS
jgi:hypothetical protein